MESCLARLEPGGARASPGKRGLAPFSTENLTPKGNGNALSESPVGRAPGRDNPANMGWL